MLYIIIFIVGYALAFHDESNPGKIRCKGVSRAIFNRTLSFQDFETVRSYGMDEKRTFTTIRSFNHRLLTINVTKIALSLRDSKSRCL